MLNHTHLFYMIMNLLNNINILRHRLELKWIELLQKAHPRGVMIIFTTKFKGIVGSLILVINLKDFLNVIKTVIQHGYHETVCMIGCKLSHGLMYFPLIVWGLGVCLCFAMHYPVCFLVLQSS